MLIGKQSDERLPFLAIYCCSKTIVTMITFNTLTDISTEKILASFNHAFSDYVVPLQLSQQQFEAKLKSDRIQLSLSVGAFEGNELIAFILHGYDTSGGKNIVYNAGTGVIPEKRENHLTVKLYDYILPVLRNIGATQLLLEVITTNAPAIHTYRHIGFETKAVLHCFKGTVQVHPVSDEWDIRELKAYHWPLLQSFWDIAPSWQNAPLALELMKDTNVSLGIFEKDALRGYVVYNPSLKRIHQLAVDANYRKRGLGRQLIAYITARYDNAFTVINVNERSAATLQFFTGLGLQPFIQQYEMERAIS